MDNIKDDKQQKHKLCSDAVVEYQKCVFIRTLHCIVVQHRPFDWSSLILHCTDCYLIDVVVFV